MFFALVLASAFCEDADEPLSDYCKGCLSLCSHIPEFLNSTDSAATWKKITKFCSSLPSAQSAVCKELANKKIFALVASISSGNSPSAICSTLGDCPNTDSTFAWLKSIWNKREQFAQQASDATAKASEFAKSMSDLLRAKVDEFVDRLVDDDDL